MFVLIIIWFIISMLMLMLVVSEDLFDKLNDYGIIIVTILCLPVIVVFVPIIYTVNNIGRLFKKLFLKKDL